MTLAIEVQHLRRVYRSRNKPDVVANDDLNVTIQRGEIFGLLGHNGAGKTTLVLQLMGLLPPTSGNILVEGVDVVRNPQAVKALVGYLPQTRMPLRYVEVRQALHFTGRLRGQSEIDTRRQVDWLIETLELSEFAHKYVNKLSGGMLRITNFAMALMGYPQVLILDEPTNDLDPHRRRQMWDMIKSMNDQYGLTCVLVTHNIAEAERVIHRLVVMRRGRMVVQGTPGEIKRQVSQTVQIDLWLNPLVESPHAVFGSLRGTVQEIHAGHYRIQLPTLEVSEVVSKLMQMFEAGELDDFHVAPLSLEDVYLNLEQPGYALE